VDLIKSLEIEYGLLGGSTTPSGGTRRPGEGSRHRRMIGFDARGTHDRN